ncbi:MAG: DNA primase [Gammaproteobacteria bacterium]|nr:DNA primase [Gammaproteobacteria bacterium]
MAGSIPRPFIDDLLNRVDIVEIIDARVPLKKKGREYWACCPFHDEKSPSFSVSQNKQFYHCFGCQQHGNAIGFLMEYDHMDFVESIETLAQHIGVEIPYEKGQYSQSRQSTKSTPQSESLMNTLQQCSEYYQRQLSQSPEAIDYLEQRGISGQTSKNFSIGFAPKGWNNLSGDNTHLIDSGMLIKNDSGKTYDRFRHRLMFPIRDRRGRTIAFGGRVIDPQDNPKYLNSPESPVFHKGEEIYGLFELKKANTQIDQIFVTEGYMDVVALAEHGITTAVATLGTAINDHQIEKLFRLSRKLVFCFDADKAGRKAAWRALENSLSLIKEGRIARFLFLPEGHDPDTFIKQFGKDTFSQQVEEASSLSKFLIDGLLTEGEILSMEGRTTFIDKLIVYLSRIPLEPLKNQIIQESEKLAAIKNDTHSLDRLKGTTKIDFSKPMPEQHWTPARLAINLLLQKPALAQSTGNLEDLAEADIPGIELLLQILDQVHEQPDISTQNLLDRFAGHENEAHLYKIAAMTPAMLNETDEIKPMFDDAIKKLRPKYAESRFMKLQEKLMSGHKLDENELHEYRQILRRDKK